MPPEDSGTRSGFWKTGLGYLTQIAILLGAIAGILAAVTQLTGGDEPAAVGRPAC